MIVVSAATGEFGRLVVSRLLERLPASEIAVAVRNPARAQHLAERGVDVRLGDYDRPESLLTAFSGADRLLFISSSMSDDRVVQHRGVVEAARVAEVGGIVYTSGLGADFVDEGVLGEHHATEQAIVDSGLPCTLLRHPIYSDFFINSELSQAIEAGEIVSSTGGRGLNTATRADLAEAAANVLTGPEHLRRTYDFTGRLWTYPQLAAVLTDMVGRTVVYRDVDEDEGIVGILGLGPVIRSGAFERQTGDLEHVLGRPAASLEDAVATALRAGVPAV